MADNDIGKVSEGLKKMGVGGLTALKVKGRGKTLAPSIHASKGTEMFTPEFSDKYVVWVFLPESKKDEAVNIIKDNSRIGKIFIMPVSDAFDLATGVEDEKAI